MLRGPRDLPPAARAATMAAWLATGRPAHVLAMALVAAAVLALLLGARQSQTLPWFVVLMTGIAETWYALRVAFDQCIFATWASSWRNPAAQSEIEMAEFDAAVNPGREPSPRDLDSRVAGAERLLRRQFACVLLQLVATLLALSMRAGYVA